MVFLPCTVRKKKKKGVSEGGHAEISTKDTTVTFGQF